jgi:cytochrome c oxidase subunit III
MAADDPALAVPGKPALAGTLAEQFDDLHQQREAAHLGMWAFLVGEVLLFGVMFTAYTVYRIDSPAAFAAGSSHLYESIGGVNTAILLISSLTMALAVHASHHADRPRTTRFLLTTAGLGVLFLSLKAVEYTLDYFEGIIPGFGFDPHHFAGSDPRHVQMFLAIYFIMTGLHGLHVLAGIIVISALALAVRRSHRPADLDTRVELTGLYWHLVDIIWIFLFPLMYLVRR